MTNKKYLFGSGIEKELIYTPDSIPNLDYESDLGNSGKAPFTRGIHANMYRGKEFTVRQLTGHGLPEDTNSKMKFMLEHGATGLSILFDIPTIQMYDSDDPKSLGQVGLSGVCVDTIADMYHLFKDIDIRNIPISIVTHYPTNTSILFSMFLAYAEEIGINWKDLKGSVQNDITLEELVRSSPEYLKPKDCFRIQCDNIEFMRQNVPNWNVMTLNGYNLREYGTSIITESAVAILNGVETIKELSNRGIEPKDVSRRIAFFWSICNDFFEEIARLRAVRRLWCNILKNKFSIEDNKSLWMRCHSQTSGTSLVQKEPLNNIVRAAYQALASVLGGTQSLHVDSYDEAYSIPTKEAALISLRTQQIIQEETGVTDVVDPLGGSYYIESLTNEIEKRITTEILEMEEKGGYISCIESGFLQKRIVEFISEQQKDLESGVIPIVGFNKYVKENSRNSINAFENSMQAEEQQKRKLGIVKLSRDKDRVGESLKELEEACKQKKNIFRFCLECAKSRCTKGEMFNAIKNSLGLWNTPKFW